MVLYFFNFFCDSQAMDFGGWDDSWTSSVPLLCVCEREREIERREREIERVTE